MIERATPIFGKLVFDCDTIVWAALRAYIEASLSGLARLSFPGCDWGLWEGDFDQGGFLNRSQSPDYEVVAWNEVGVVGLAYELGWGPVELLDLSPDAVTGGPDDVRGAVPGLPEELEPVFVRAVGLLDTGTCHRTGKGDEVANYQEKLAGVGFWLCGDRSGGSFFEARDANGADRLAPWGLLWDGRLRRLCCENHFGPDKPEEVPIHEIITAVTERAVHGPTEFTADELATLIPVPPKPEILLRAQRLLEKVGITWPGSPELPPEEPPGPRTHDAGYENRPPTTVQTRRPEYHRFYLDQDAIVHAALRAYIENLLAWLDPLDRHPFAASFVPDWTGDQTSGAFRNGDEHGSYEVVAWTEAGVVGLAYERGYGPIEHRELPLDAVKGGPEDVLITLADLPDELLPTLEIAAGLLDLGAHGEKLASVGVWLHGELVGGSFYEYNEYYLQKGKDRLRAWGRLKERRLRRWYQGSYVTDLGRTKAAPIQALADALTDRALKGPTELLPDELATLLPTPPDPERLLDAQNKLQKVGITWPSSPEVFSNAR